LSGRKDTKAVATLANIRDDGCDYVDDREIE
jgi:hypothetical protein